MDFLIFQVYGPLVSWGTTAVGGDRYTAKSPSKSAVVGLVSAALGIKRGDEEASAKIFDSLGVAVKSFSKGYVVSDFHTAQVSVHRNGVRHYTRKGELAVPSDQIKTSLSTREYIADSYHQVAIYLKEDSEYTLESIADALNRPVFHLYFGRKANVPALPLHPVVYQAHTLVEAFDSYEGYGFITPTNSGDPDWVRESFKGYVENNMFGKNVTYYWEDGIEPGIDPLLSANRPDKVISRKRWQFSTRTEFSATAPCKEANHVFE